MLIIAVSCRVILDASYSNFGRSSGALGRWPVVAQAALRQSVELLSAPGKRPSLMLQLMRSRMRDQGFRKVGTAMVI
jgi:hypothetical protein